MEMIDGKALDGENGVDSGIDIGAGATAIALEQRPAAQPAQGRADRVGVAGEQDGLAVALDLHEDSARAQEHERPDHRITANVGMPAVQIARHLTLGELGLTFLLTLGILVVFRNWFGRAATPVRA